MTFLGWKIVLIPPYLFVIGLGLALTGLANREKAYLPISVNRLSLAIFSNGFQFLFYKLKDGLILGRIIGQLVSNFSFYSTFIRQLRRYLRYVKPTQIRKAFFRYIDFFRYETPLNIARGFANELPTFLLAYLFGMHEVGVYLLAVRILAGPLGILEQSLNIIFYQRFSSIHRSGEELYPYVKKGYLYLLKLAIVPVTLLLIFSPKLFETIFGPQWLSAGQVSQILIPWLLLSFLNTPITALVPVLNKQRQLLFLEAGKVTLVVGLSFAAKAMFNGYMGALAGMSLAYTVYHVFLLCYYLHISKNSHLKAVYAN